MGSGRWDAGTYRAVTMSNVAAGTSFGYTTTTRSTKAAKDWTVHEDLDPLRANSAGLFDGKNVRESRDSDEHPLTVPIAIFFDETGSMRDVPTVLQKKLGELFGVLLRKGYVTDPQVMVGAYGDAYTDRVPLQVSQFESDNRIDDALNNLFLEGNGGGNDGESALLAWYFMGTHTATDAWDKRGKKGYAFTIGDEVTLTATRDQVKRLTGDDIEGSLTPERALELATERWEVYHLLIDNATAKEQLSQEFYRNLLGERCVVLGDPDAVSETIALLIGVLEGTVDIDEGVDDLRAVGASDAAVSAAEAAVRPFADGGSGKTGEVVSSDGTPSDLDDGVEDGLTTV